MADNVTLDVGTGGDTIAADDDGTAKHQLVKVEFGGNGTFTPVTSSVGLPVGDAGGSLTVDDGGTTLSIDDGAGSITVDGSVAVSGTVTTSNATTSVVGTGTEAAAQRVTIASDSTGVLSVDDNGGSLTVDGTVAATQSGTWTEANSAAALTSLQLIDDTVYTDGTGTPSKAIAVAGTDGTNPQILSTNATGHVNIADGGNSITVDGTVAATQSGTWTVQPGNTANTTAWKVDGSAVTQPVSGTVTANAGTGTQAVSNTVLSVVGTGTEATAQRVTIATDSTGVLSVDDNGGSLTVDGTVAVSGTVTTSNTVLSVVGTGTEAAAQRVTIATDSTGVLSVDDNGSSLTVDYATTGSGTATGALRVELPTNGTGVVGLNAGTNAIGKLAANSGVDIGDVDVTSISAGTNAIGNVGLIGRTTGGLTPYRSIDLDETEEEVKATAGQLFGWYLFNAAATTHYVKVYNATAANVTVGTTTPILTIPVPAGSAANAFTDIGIAFGTALTIAATTGIADADTGAPAANAVTANVFYT